MIESSLRHGEPMSVPDPIRPFSRVVRSVAAYGIATALMLVSPLLVFAPASLFHCAMRNGRLAAWTAAIVATGLAGLYFAQVASASGGSQVKLVYSSFIGITLSIAVPSMLAIPLVENRRKFGIVLTFALVCSATGLAMTELIMRAVSFSPYAVQFTDATNLANRMADANRAVAMQSSMGRTALWLLTHSPQVLPAMILLDIALVFILSLMMYGRLSAWRAFAKTRVADSETRRTYLFRNLQLPEWLLFLFVLGGLTPLLSGIAQEIAANVLAIMICLYILQGLAIFRSILVRAGAGYVGGTLGFFLLGMLCLTGIGLVLLAGVGLFDPFFDFRKLNRKDDSHESHTD
ncbi:MAG TPA: hypothetical protein VLV78_14145 [Thermoanaerobaculia bacterium]|nr:hypothetical protein [Thermoanaerobaculia bacterium]